MNERDFFMSLLDYNPFTGAFRWRVDRGRGKIRQTAGSITCYGYRRISIDKQGYYASRIAWLFTHGRWPEYDIDHINGARADDRMENLREVTRRGNSINRIVHRKGRLAGTSFRGEVHTIRPWRARITLPDGTRKHLGDFSTEVGAHNVYMKAYKEIEEGILNEKTL